MASFFNKLKKKKEYPVGSLPAMMQQATSEMLVGSDWALSLQVREQGRKTHA